MTDPVPGISLADYCLGFSKASEPWPTLPLEDAPGISWWRSLLAAGCPVGGWFAALKPVLPQLRMVQEEGVSKSEAYRAAVLRGEAIPDSAPAAPALSRPDALTLQVVGNPCGAIPVLSTPHRGDFEQLLRAMAHRCEPAVIPEGVHAQAIGGLIHWGLIEAIGRSSRAQLILLHDSPYGSVGWEHVPGMSDEQTWIVKSGEIRLEHELTHIATKRLLGEMRINLLDELIADAMGMSKALGSFSADLFRRCLGLNEDGTIPPLARANTYISALSPDDRVAAVRLCLERATELEKLMTAKALPAEQIPLLRWSVSQHLDHPMRKP